MARLIKSEKEVEGRYEEVWLVVEEDALDQWPEGPLEIVGKPATRLTGPQRLEAAEWLLASGDSAMGEGVREETREEMRERPWTFRDYFIYRSQQGGLLWIYSERLGATPQGARQRAWYLHGFFA